MKKLMWIPAALALAAGPTFASPATTINQGTSHVTTQLNDDVIAVETHRSAAGVVARDALYGGVAGLAVGGGVALINNGDNWQRDLAVGAGVGLLVGAVVGVVDIAAGPSYDRAATVDRASLNRGFNSNAVSLPGVRF